jgi:hypothetical protein
VSAAIHFDRPTMMSEPEAWVRALDYAVHAETPTTFKKRLADWWPFFPDAAAVVDRMVADPRRYDAFRRGMQIEREKRYAGDEWAHEFGAIVAPENAIVALGLASSANVPWGAALVRIAEATDALSALPARTDPKPETP